MCIYIYDNLHYIHIITQHTVVFTVFWIDKDLHKDLSFLVIYFYTLYTFTEICCLVEHRISSCVHLIQHMIVEPPQICSPSANSSNNVSSG